MPNTTADTGPFFSSYAAIKAAWDHLISEFDDQIVAAHKTAAAVAGPLQAERAALAARQSAIPDELAAAARAADVARITALRGEAASLPVRLAALDIQIAEAEQTAVQALTRLYADRLKALEPGYLDQEALYRQLEEERIALLNTWRQMYSFSQIQQQQASYAAQRVRTARAAAQEARAALLATV